MSRATGGARPWNESAGRVGQRHLPRPPTSALIDAPRQSNFRLRASFFVAIITTATTPDSHPDCRALLIQIVALHPPPQNAPATCIRSDGSPRTAGISTQTIPRASAPSPQSASALPRHRSPSIPSARSSLPPVDLLPMSPVYSVTYLAGQDPSPPSPP